jgi:hypothetical protein
MAVTLEPNSDPAISAAVRASVALAGLEGGSDPVLPKGSAWWRAGLEEARGRAPVATGAARYEAARSPRRTRGATRA